MSDLITVEKLLVLKPKITDTPESLAAVITVASASLRAKRPEIDSWIASGRVDPVLVEFVVASMVERVTADKVRMETISQASFSYDTDWQAAGIFPTEDELASITPAAASGRSKPWGAARPPIGLAGRWR